MKKVLLSLVVGLGLVGCVSPSYNATSQRSEISKPPIGSINTASVGDQMLVQGIMEEMDALIIHSTKKVSAYTIPAGKYALSGQNESGKYFRLLGLNGEFPITRVLADPPKDLMVSSDNKLCVVTVFNAKLCGDDQGFDIQNITSTQKDSFQQTLIYSGKVGNKINIGYREFSSNLARPAFNNDVEYDLSESKEIGYKGALLQIIDANNQSIKYKVLKNFNKAN